MVKKITKIANAQSKAKKIKLLFKTYEKTFRSYKDMSDFKEPVVFLIRRTRKVEFFDNATTGEFTFEHSNKKDRTIELEPQFLHTFDYGKRTFKGYILHEDYPRPLPEEPIVNSELYLISMDKALHDIRKHQADLERGIGLKWKQILIGLAILAGVIFGIQLLAKIMGFDIDLFPFGNKETAQAVGTAVTNTPDIINPAVTG